MNISAVFVGELRDRGFNASALAGIEAARSIGRHSIKVVDGISYDKESMAAGLSRAAENSDVALFIGGQGDKVTPAVAKDFPDSRFAVIQGSVVGHNYCSYEVRQQESAFLAGVLAANWTKTGIVGHLSGHRVKPGLKGRAAFAAGVNYGGKGVSVLTSFCGTQDDSQAARRWAEAQISSGADVIFTMLNGARQGVIDACRVAHVHQIGNATNWCDKEPEIFIASAIARIDAAVVRAIEDAEADRQPEQVVQLGLADSDSVSLALREDITGEIRASVLSATEALMSGELIISTNYDGPEFTAPHLS